MTEVGIHNGHEFKTEYGVIAKVVNYDDTSGLCI